MIPETIKDIENFKPEFVYNYEDNGIEYALHALCDIEIINNDTVYNILLPAELSNHFHTIDQKLKIMSIQYSQIFFKIYNLIDMFQITQPLATMFGIFDNMPISERSSLILKVNEHINPEFVISSQWNNTKICNLENTDKDIVCKCLILALSKFIGYCQNINENTTELEQAIYWLIEAQDIIIYKLKNNLEFVRTARTKSQTPPCITIEQFTEISTILNNSIITPASAIFYTILGNAYKSRNTKTTKLLQRYIDQITRSILFSKILIIIENDSQIKTGDIHNELLKNISPSTNNKKVKKIRKYIDEVIEEVKILKNKY